ncbi:MAG: phage tail tape measure protein, partial [Pseudomonadota bacterium]
AVLGMMQTSLQAGESGTALRSLAENAGKAQTAFNDLATKSDNPIHVRILDDDGMLRSLPKLLGDLQTRYGDTLDAYESEEIKKAFGTTEALKLIQALWGQEEALRTNIDAIQSASASGRQYADTMARAANNDLNSRMQLLAQNADLLKQSIGTALVPILNDLIPRLRTIIDSVSGWVRENPKLAQTIAAATVAVGAIAIVLGPVLSIVALFKAVLGGTIFIAAKLAAAMPAVIVGIKAIGAAAMANPIGALVGGIAMAAGLIIANWDRVREFLAPIWEPVRSIWQGFGDWISAFFANITDLIDKALGGITSAIDKVGSAASWIGDTVGGWFDNDEEMQEARKSLHRAAQIAAIAAPLAAPAMALDIPTPEQITPSSITQQIIAPKIDPVIASILPLSPTQAGAEHTQDTPRDRLDQQLQTRDFMAQLRKPDDRSSPQPINMPKEASQSSTLNQTITINLATSPNHDPQHIADAVKRLLEEQSHGALYDS